MSTQAQFDQLIHGIVTTLNDILCPNKEVVIPAGTTVTMPFSEPISVRSSNEGSLLKSKTSASP